MPPAVRRRTLLLVFLVAAAGGGGAFAIAQTANTSVGDHRPGQPDPAERPPARPARAADDARQPPGWRRAHAERLVPVGGRRRPRPQRRQDRPGRGHEEVQERPPRRELPQGEPEARRQAHPDDPDAGRERRDRVLARRQDRVRLRPARVRAQGRAEPRGHAGQGRRHDPRLHLRRPDRPRQAHRRHPGAAAGRLADDPELPAQDRQDLLAARPGRLARRQDAARRPQPRRPRGGHRHRDEGRHATCPSAPTRTAPRSPATASAG